MAVLVLDCSMALAWSLPDEASPQADAAQALVTTGGAAVPAHWPLEVANSLTMAIRRGRINSAYRAGVLTDLAALELELDDATAAQAWGDTTTIADTLHLTIYDAAYLELAKRRSLPLASLDKALQDAAREIGIGIV